MSEVHAHSACTVSVVNDGGDWSAVLLFNFMYAARIPYLEFCHDEYFSYVFPTLSQSRDCCDLLF